MPWSPPSLTATGTRQQALPSIMIEYNPKAWFTFIFQFHKADTFRRLLPVMVCIALYCGLIEYLEIGYLHLSDVSRIRHVSIVHTLLGLALSMLLVFRTNTAYDRWWEARKLWGSLVNSSRNLALQLAALLPDAGERAFFREAIGAFPAALMEHLRSVPPNQRRNLPPGLARHLEGHVPNQIAAAIYARLVALGMPTDRLLLLNPDLRNFAEVCGACERIRNTPIPFSYSVFLKKFIFIYVMTMPVSYSVTLGWLVIPVVVLVFYALASLELIAEEIENPFGTDPNDLPLETICVTIEKSVNELLPDAA
jgi:putative membrane protein